MRGISPIVSQILMIAIAVAAAVILYSMVTGAVSKQQAQVETTQFDAITITEIGDVNAATADINIYVTNQSNHTVELADAYIIKDNAVVCGPETLVGITPNTIAAGDTTKVTVDFNQSLCTLNTGQQYSIKIVTKNGAPAERLFTT